MKIKNWNLILISFFCLLSTTLILYWVFKFSAYGIDFTDEGYYLHWISNPFLYKSSLSQFGYIYHPLYNLVDCTDIANAWVLYESKGPRSISTDLLTSLGMNFPIQYQKVGSWKTASGAGGYKEIRTQELYKPLNVNIAKASCELKRKKF